MANTDQLRDRASRLLAMAISARDKGQAEYADRLTEQAEDLDAAKAKESAAGQQQQQPQKRKKAAEREGK